MSDVTFTDRPVPVDDDPYSVRRANEASDHGGFVNVGQTERQISAGVGAALVGLGLLRRTPLTLAGAGAGLALIARGLSGHSMAYDKMGRDTAGDAPPDPSLLYDKGLHLAEAVTVSRPADELYRHWRDLSNHPAFMPNVKSVDARADGKSHWVLEGPGGTSVEYDAEIIADEENKLVSWRSLGGAPVEHVGTARFHEAPGGRGTEVHLEVQYLPPGASVVGSAVAGFGRKLLYLFGQDPGRDVRRGLRNFKRLMETGHIPSIEGQPRGNCSA